MKTLAVCLTLACASGLASAGEAAITFVQPQSYQGFPFRADYRDDMLKEIADHFADRAAKKLPEGTRLKVEVLDMTLAGHIVPSYEAGLVRVATGQGDWPHMKIRYSITDANGLIASGEEQLKDMGYFRRINIYSRGDPVRYEKKMIDDWIHEKQLALH